ncbi:MAG: response regulator [Verrucomicrobia bacterium]|nr:response regulator [Verrucomicrobiota bacterium]
MNPDPPNPVEPNRRVLVVDDNPAIHEDMRKVLGAPCRSRKPHDLVVLEALILGSGRVAVPAAEFELEFALQGEEALAKVESAQAAGRPFALAFVDIRMPPGWDGVETISRLWKVSPDLQVVVCTAYSDYAWEELRQRLGESDSLLILKKPFDNIEVVQLAHALTRKWLLNRQAALRMEDLDRLVALRAAELKEANARLTQEMTQRERMEQQLLQAQRLEAVGHLAGGLAHEFNNQHAVIQGFAVLSQEEIREDQPQLKESIAEILNASRRVTRLTGELLAFSRQQMIQPAAIDLNLLLDTLQPALKSLLTPKISLAMEPAPRLPPVFADASALELVISNLTTNARDAMTEGGRLTLRTRPAPAGACEPGSAPADSPKQYVCFEVTDSNPTSAPVKTDRVFDPFSSPKDLTQGTGLRLASVYGLVKQHDGWIEVAGEPGGGTTFRVFWPAA